MDDHARDLARLIKQQARRVDRELNLLRQMCARFEEEAGVTDTSEREDTGHAENEARSSAHLQAV